MYYFASEILHMLFPLSCPSSHCARPLYSQPLDDERLVLKFPSSLSDKGAKQGTSKTTYLCELWYLIHL